MKFLKYSLIALLLIVVVGIAGCMVTSSGLKSKQGYAAFTLPSWYTTDTTFRLSLGSAGIAPLKWVVQYAVKQSPNELSPSEQLLLALLDDLKGARVHIYQINDDRDVFEYAISQSVVKMKYDGWQTLVSIREEDKHLVIMQSGDEQVISGLSILISTPEEAVFVNLLGQIKPESLVLITDEWI